MKRIIYLIAIMFCCSTVSAIPIVTNSTTRDTLNFPCNPKDSLSQKTNLASGDSIWLTVLYPGGAMAYLDSSDWDNAQIKRVSAPNKPCSTYNWNDQVRDIDGTGFNGVYRWDVIVKDVSLGLSTAYDGEFQIIGNVLDGVGNIRYTSTDSVVRWRGQHLRGTTGSDTAFYAKSMGGSAGGMFEGGPAGFGLYIIGYDVAHALYARALGSGDGICARAGTGGVDFRLSTYGTLGDGTNVVLMWPKDSVLFYEAALQAVQDMATEFVRNGNFEIDSTNGTTAPLQWTMMSGDSARIVTSTVNGRRKLHFTSNQADDTLGMYQLLGVLQPGQYMLSGHVRTSLSGNMKAWIVIDDGISVGYTDFLDSIRVSYGSTIEPLVQKIVTITDATKQYSIGLLFTSNTTGQYAEFDKIQFKYIVPPSIDTVNYIKAGNVCGGTAFTRYVVVLDSGSADAPVADAPVFINNLDQSGTPYFALTDNDGKATFQLDGGTWTVLMNKSGYQAILDTITISGTGTDTIYTYTSSANKTTVYGDLFNALGQPFEYAEVRFYLKPVPAGSVLTFHDTTIVQTIVYDTANINGHWEISVYSNKVLSDSSYYVIYFRDQYGTIIPRESNWNIYVSDTTEINYNALTKWRD